MSGRKVLIAGGSSLPLSERFAKVERRKVVREGVKSKSAVGREAQDTRKARLQKQASKGRQLTAESKRNIGSQRQNAGKQAKSEARVDKKKGAAGGAGKAGRAVGKISAKPMGSKGPKDGKGRRGDKGKEGGKPAGGAGGKGKGKDGAKPFSKEGGKDDLDYELDKFRFAAGKGPNPDVSRMDAELDAYRTAAKADAAAGAGAMAEGDAAAPAAGTA